MVTNGRKKWQKLLLVDAFPKLTMKKRASKLTGMDLNIWLKNHLIKDRSSFVNMRAPPVNSNSHDEIFSFVIRGSENIRSLIRKLSFKFCQYGVYLD